MVLSQMIVDIMMSVCAASSYLCLEVYSHHRLHKMPSILRGSGFCSVQSKENTSRLCTSIRLSYPHNYPRKY